MRYQMLVDCTEGPPLMRASFAIAFCLALCSGPAYAQQDTWRTSWAPDVDYRPPPNAFQAGKLSDVGPIHVCQAKTKGKIHAGMLYRSSCYMAVDGREVRSRTWKALVTAPTLQWQARLSPSAIRVEGQAICRGTIEPGKSFMGIKVPAGHVIGVLQSGVCMVGWSRTVLKLQPFQVLSDPVATFGAQLNAAIKALDNAVGDEAIAKKSEELGTIAREGAQRFQVMRPSNALKAGVQRLMPLFTIVKARLATAKHAKARKSVDALAKRIEGATGNTTGGAKQIEVLTDLRKVLAQSLKDWAKDKETAAYAAKLLTNGDQQIADAILALEKALPPAERSRRALAEIGALQIDPTVMSRALDVIARFVKASDPVEVTAKTVDAVIATLPGPKWVHPAKSGAAKWKAAGFLVTGTSVRLPPAVFISKLKQAVPEVQIMRLACLQSAVPQAFSLCERVLAKLGTGPFAQAVEKAATKRLKKHMHRWCDSSGQGAEGTRFVSVFGGACQELADQRKMLKKFTQTINKGIRAWRKKRYSAARKALDSAQTLLNSGRLGRLAYQNQNYEWRRSRAVCDERVGGHGSRLNPRQKCSDSEELDAALAIGGLRSRIAYSETAKYKKKARAAAKRQLEKQRRKLPQYERICKAQLKVNLRSQRNLERAAATGRTGAMRRHRKQVISSFNKACAARRNALEVLSSYQRNGQHIAARGVRQAIYTCINKWRACR